MIADGRSCHLLILRSNAESERGFFILAWKLPNPTRRRRQDDRQEEADTDGEDRQTGADRQTDGQDDRREEADKDGEDRQTETDRQADEHTDDGSGNLSRSGSKLKAFKARQADRRLNKEVVERGPRRRARRETRVVSGRSAPRRGAEPTNTEEV